VIGWAIRRDDGQKVCKPGSKRGLTLVWPLDNYAGATADDPIFIVEGASDTAAGIGVGLDIVGRPSATGGLTHLVDLLRDRHVCIVAENDTAGRRGADQLAAGLCGACASVRVIVPPTGIKDLRAWVVRGATHEDVQAAARAAQVIRAPRQGGDARITFAPIPLSAVGPVQPPEWVWLGYVARGHVTLFAGLWKAGKTTLIAHLLRDVGMSRGLAEGLPPARVLVISEESRTLWARRREDMGIGDHVHLQVRPFMGRPTMAQWEQLIHLIAEAVRSNRYDLVVFDTLASLWPVLKENDAGEVGTALAPLHQITATGAGVLLVHHPRKGDAGEGQAARGSGALAGFVDIIVELRRYAAEDRDDRRRVLSSYSRFDETPAETVMELRETGYAIIGGRAEVRQGDRWAIIGGLLPTIAPGVTWSEVSDRWPGDSKPGKRTLQLDLAAGAKSARWAQTGGGHKGDPFRYWRGEGFDSRTPGPIDARNEWGTGEPMKMCCQPATSVVDSVRGEAIGSDPTRHRAE
jgi:hypothetical protein